MPVKEFLFFTKMDEIHPLYMFTVQLLAAWAACELEETAHLLELRAEHAECGWRQCRCETGGKPPVPSEMAGGLPV